MTYFFYIITCLFFVILQTSIVPYLPLSIRFYDLLAPFIIYLGLFRPARESIFVILFIGFVMDSLSGGLFGLYMTTYFWLFIGVRWLTKFFQVKNSTLFLFIVAIGVLVENCIFIGIVAILGPTTQFSKTIIRTVSWQILWALFTGPIFLIILNYTHRRWDKWFKELFVESN